MKTSDNQKHKEYRTSERQIVIDTFTERHKNIVIDTYTERETKKPHTGQEDTRVVI